MQISTDGAELRKTIVYVFDRPGSNSGSKFLGHLIKKIDDQSIESVITINDYLVTISTNERGYGMIT